MAGPYVFFVDVERMSKRKQTKEYSVFECILGNSNLRLHTSWSELGGVWLDGSPSESVPVTEMTGG